MLRNDDLGPALVQFGDDGVAVEGFVGDQSAELNAVDQGGDANGVEAMAGQECEANQIAERVGEREDLCGYAALGPADGLARSPPFAPWP